jgi:hypothetical protein
MISLAGDKVHAFEGSSMRSLADKGISSIPGVVKMQERRHPSFEELTV